MIRFDFRSRNRNFVRRVVSACVIGLICSGGCSPGNPPDIDPAWKLDEHGNPDFRPMDFEDAMAASKARYAALVELPKAEMTPEARKFRQIVRWLPEFAADTPIKRAGWEELKRRTDRMEAAARQPGFFAQDRMDAFAQEMQSIAALVPPDTLYRKLESREKPDQQGESATNETGSDRNIAGFESSAQPSKGEER